jgi:hydrogenase nickel incorporation protein HypA/HybF
MHEMSLCENIVQIAEQQARQQNFTKVNAVRLEVGAASCVEPEAMMFCFEAVARGTLAEGARLQILQVPSPGWCVQCARDVIIKQRFDPCPVCGTAVVQVKAGTELKIKDMEVE